MPQILKTLLKYQTYAMKRMNQRLKNLKCTKILRFLNTKLILERQKM